ncbi:MAG: hypothetical protein KDD35_03800 [Bdellovibrionales bacterium]|nr:hypothetical protein [Bdellovibrionales bacterium]
MNHFSKKLIYRFAVGIAFFLLAIPAQAKLFRNAYISFELPPKWKCALEATDWICVSEFFQKKRDAMIILTAKEAGPSDSLQAYEALLKASRTIPDALGKPVSSQVIGVKNRVINSSMWIDGMHLASEAPSYYTRYVGTIKSNIAILVTFSAHKRHYTKYSSDFAKAIQSLQVVASKSMLSNKPLAATRGSNETFGAPIGQVLPTDLGDSLPPEASGSGKAGSSLIGIFILAAVLAYYLLFVRKKKRK